jgi:hypothetical protein
MHRTIQTSLSFAVQEEMNEAAKRNKILAYVYKSVYLVVRRTYINVPKSSKTAQTSQSYI